MHDDGLPMLRVPPHSIPAETTVLGALLLDNRAFDRVGDMVSDSDFYRYEHRLIYAAIGALVVASKPADIITVYEHLQRDGKGEEVGGLPYLNSLAQATLSASNARRYAEIVREHSIARKVASAGDEIAQMAFAADRSPNALLDAAQQKLQAIHVSTGRTFPTHISDSVVSLLDRIQNRHDGTEPRGIPTGIGLLDRLLGGGFKGGKQVVIAARPSIGKSSLALQFCINVAVSGHAAAFLSQEMAKDELVDRGAANLGRLDLERVISGQMEDDDWARLTEAVERMRDLPLFLDDQPALTLADIQAKARALKRQNDLKLLVVDYIQLCAAGVEKDNRHHQIEALSRGLKNLAKQLDITVITLSQLNREVEKRATGRPILSDLKESGAIEEDADVVMLLSRNGDEKDGFRTINCDIPKNRQGKVGGVSLGFDGRYQQWHSVAAPLEFKTPAKQHWTDDV